jgi:hypothetical protein
MKSGAKAGLYPRTMRLIDSPSFTGIRETEKLGSCLNGVNCANLSQENEDLQFIAPEVKNEI